MSMGIVVVGGLFFALILTLFVIPSMYILMATNKVKMEKNEDPLIN
jgi:multidrug efflux pump subunit AcrB